MLEKMARKHPIVQPRPMGKKNKAWLFWAILEPPTVDWWHPIGSGSVGGGVRSEEWLQTTLANNPSR